jgi:DNA transformation protein
MQQHEFVEYVVHDALADVPDVTLKRMFGGYGLYHDGDFFGLIADDRLYFKVTDKTRGMYEAAGSEPFTYTRRDKTIVMGTYYEVPADVLEDRKKAAIWAAEAYTASRN